MIISREEKISRGIMYILVSVIALSMLLPIWHVFMKSLSETKRSMEGGLFLWPRGFSFASYRVVIENHLIQTTFVNTVIVTLGGTLLNLVMTFLAAYPLSRRDLYGRSVIQYGIFFTMIFSGGMIPTYLVVSKLGLTNSLWCLIIPGAISAYNTFVLRNFIDTLPVSLQESARIDGASDWTVLFRIVVPLCGPVIAVLAMFYGVGHWNGWFSCVLYNNNVKHYTLQPMVRDMLLVNGNDYFHTSVDTDDYGTMESLRMATVAVATVPILCVYPFLQRYFVKGVMIGAVKG